MGSGGFLTSLLGPIGESFDAVAQQKRFKKATQDANDQHNQRVQEAERKKREGNQLDRSVGEEVEAARRERVALAKKDGITRGSGVALLTELTPSRGGVQIDTNVGG